MNVKSILPFGAKRGELSRAEFNPFSSLQREIDRVFADFTRGWPALRAFEVSPQFDVTERDKEIAITAELPGLEEKDVKVELVDNVLTISGEKKAEKEEKDEKRHIVERSYGSFSRSLELPEGVKPEHIKASMAKGVLTVTVPKPAVAQPEAKKIEVKAAA
jgi:HSP20 family protein